MLIFCSTSFYYTFDSGGVCREIWPQHRAFLTAEVKCLVETKHKHPYVQDLSTCLESQVVITLYIMPQCPLLALAHLTTNFYIGV